MRLSLPRVSRQPDAKRPRRAPLPSLTDAFSRRAALFGAVTVSGALVGSAARAVSGPAPSLPSPADDRLCALASEVKAHLSGAVPAFQPGWNTAEQQVALDAVDRLYRVMAETDATSHSGVLAKARAIWAGRRFDVSDTWTVSDSLAYDVLRLAGEVA